jgi:predicted phosphodiesterase
MRIGVISDIHGNCVALDAVLADVAHHPVDRWVCLGDVIQGGTQPEHVVDRLRELDCPVVLGNADAFLLDASIGEAVVTDELRAVRDWTIEAIGSDGLEFIRTFHPTVEIDVGEGERMLCFHGSPASYDTIIGPDTPRDDLERELASDALLQCGGHIHHQWTTTVGRSTFFNPGSVGLAYNRHLPRESFYFYPFAEFAIVNVGDGPARLELTRVPFDVDELERASQASGHPNGQTLAARFRPPA